MNGTATGTGGRGDGAILQTTETPTAATAIAATTTATATTTAMATMAATAAAYQPIVARVAIAVRPAVAGDLPFIDRLQKQHSRELGFLPTAALEGKIRLGQVLIAERASGSGLVASGSDEEQKHPPSLSELPATSHQPPALPVGYLIAADRYQKRDEIGYVTQINVVPEYRRSLVAAQLLQAQFDRSAYGCRLYSCWCAQDLKANEFWEAMGFTAIAFRTGSMTKGAKKTPRVHIFWQKRIRDGDTTTAWWYPSQTGGGEIREDRLVFPILPGVHWRDVGPIVLERGVLEPAVTGPTALAGATDRSPAVGDSQVDAPLPPTGDMDVAPAKRKASRSKAEPATPVVRPLVSPRARGGFWAAEEGVVDTYRTPRELKEEAEAAKAAERAAAAKKKPRATKPKPTARPIDPRLTAMSRELRDQWAERAECAIAPTLSKHDVKRVAQATHVEPRRLNQAA